jgi:hypothetical protein
MLALDGDGLGTVALEVLIWGVPAVLAARLATHLPPGHGRTWIIVAVSCAVIVLDKLIDLQMAAMSLGRPVVRRLAPEMTMGGPDRLGRTVLLGILVLLATGALWLLVRADRHWNRPKVQALAGLVGVMTFLGARLIPTFSSALGSHGLGWAIELGCCALVWKGILAARPADES